MGRVSMSTSRVSLEDRIKALEAENESLEAQLEPKNKAPSHWDTAPEGAIKLVSCDDETYYINAGGEYWSLLHSKWDEDTDPQYNTLIDERTL